MPLLALFSALLSQWSRLATAHEALGGDRPPIIFVPGWPLSNLQMDVVLETTPPAPSTVSRSGRLRGLKDLWDLLGIDSGPGDDVDVLPARCISLLTANERMTFQFVFDPVAGNPLPSELPWECAAGLLRLAVDEPSRHLKDEAGGEVYVNVSTSIVNFGSVTCAHVYNEEPYVVWRLIEAGYEPGKDLFVACYDWLRAPGDAVLTTKGDTPKPWVQLMKELVERAVATNGNRKAVIIGHSSGGPYSHAFISHLHHQAYPVQDLIDRYVTLAASPEGSGALFVAALTGVLADASVVDKTPMGPNPAIAMSMRYWPSIWYQLPIARAFGDQVLVKTPQREYLAKDMEDVLEIDDDEAKERLVDVYRHAEVDTPPLVPLNCWYSEGLETIVGAELSDEISNDFNYNLTKFITVDGDSSQEWMTNEGCQRWTDAQSKAGKLCDIRAFAKIPHMQMASNATVMNELMQIIHGIDQHNRLARLKLEADQKEAASLSTDSKRQQLSLGLERAAAAGGAATNESSVTTETQDASLPSENDTVVTSAGNNKTAKNATASSSSSATVDELSEEDKEEQLERQERPWMQFVAVAILACVGIGLILLLFFICQSCTLSREARIRAQMGDVDYSDLIDDALDGSKGNPGGFTRLREAPAPGTTRENGYKAGGEVPRLSAASGTTHEDVSELTPLTSQREVDGEARGRRQQQQQTAAQEQADDDDDVNLTV